VKSSIRFNLILCIKLSKSLHKYKLRINFRCILVAQHCYYDLLNCSLWHTVALLKFSSVQFRPPSVWTWTWTSYKISEPHNFFKSYFSIFFVSKHFETHVQSWEISYLCKAVAQTTFDKPNRYYTTDPNKCTCRKATQNMAITHHLGEGLLLYIKILK